MADYLLTEADRRLIQAHIDALKRRPPPPRVPQLDPADREDWTAPEVYAAYTPAGGIPAISDPSGLETGTGTGTGTLLTGHDMVEPGSASCDIFRVTTSSKFGSTKNILVWAGFSRTVFNLSGAAISGKQFIPVVRDKFGAWWAIEPAGGSTIVPDDLTACVQVLSDVTIVCNGDGSLTVTKTFKHLRGNFQVSDTPC